MPASLKIIQGFLPPFVPIAHRQSVLRATIEQISLGISIAGIDDAHSLNKKVRHGLTSEEATRAKIRIVPLQIHPRAKEDVQVLSRDAARIRPPEDVYRALEENWESFSGFGQTDIVCPDAEADQLLAMAKKYGGHSQAISGVVLQTTRRNQLAESVGDSNVDWQALPLRKRPSSDFCGIAMYGYSRNERTVVCLPIGQHWMPKHVGDWRQILRQDVERARRFAIDQSAGFEICGPCCASCYWPTSAPPRITPSHIKESNHAKKS